MLTDVVRKYQSFDPETKQFTRTRGLREYARLLGVNHATLSLLYSTPGRQPSRGILQKLAHTFPEATEEIGSALAASIVGETEPDAASLAEPAGVA